MRVPFVTATALLILLGVGCQSAAPDAPLSSPVPMNNAPAPAVRTRVNVPPLPGVLEEAERTKKQVRITTEKGDIVFALFGNEAPLTVSNFVWLTRHNFYNGLTFHRVEPGFVIQGGDPNGNGTGGPGYQFADERVTRNYDEGIVAMANAGPNTNGSQFFIMLADNATLPKNYTIFGKVVSGIEVVHQIRVGDVMQEVRLEDAP
jgi:cyclophilin family peptidyl-prolyl cis-trans isomerase